MARKKPFRYTAVDYFVNKSGDGSVLCSRETVYEEILPPEEGREFRIISRKTYANPDVALDKMLDNAGKIMSDFLSVHPESKTLERLRNS